MTDRKKEPPKKDLPPDWDFPTENVASATDVTGMVPALPHMAGQAHAYEAIHSFPRIQAESDKKDPAKPKSP